MSFHIHKPQLVRMLLDRLDGKYEESLGFSDEDRMKYVLSLYITRVVLISQHTGQERKLDTEGWQLDARIVGHIEHRQVSVSSELNE